MSHLLPSRVPLELLDEIFRKVPDNNDMRQLQLCNSTFFHVASRVLYHKIQNLTFIQSILLLKTLSKNDKYSGLVRCLDLSWAQCLPTDNTYRLLNRALNRLRNLKVLSLDDSRISISILEGCTFSLERFTNSILCDGALSRFLVTQPTLKELCLRGFPCPVNPFILPSTALPHLTHFRSVHVGPSMLAEIIEGRSIESVSAAMVMAQMNRFIDALTCSSVPLKRLSIMFFDSPVLSELWPAIGNRLPQLEAMHIVVLTSGRSKTETLRDCGPLLSAFKHLSSVTYVAARGLSSVDDDQKVAEMWHKYCPTLKTIILPKGTIWYNNGGQWELPA